jgi:hypothetical protein
MRNSLAMGEHVHVRISRSLGVTEDGVLTEEKYCRCGATWIKTYPANDHQDDLDQ